MSRLSFLLFYLVNVSSFSESESEVTQSCPTLCDPTDCSLPGFSIHGIFPGKNTGVGCHFLLQGIFQHRDWTQVSHVAGRLFTIWATREVLKMLRVYKILLVHANIILTSLSNHVCHISRKKKWTTEISSHYLILAVYPLPSPGFNNRRQWISPKIINIA